MATLELIISEFVVLAVVCFLLIRYYKGNMVTYDVAFSVYLSWVLGFAGILLLPYDISVAVVDDRKNEILVIVWNFVYWSTFGLAWLVLPLQMEFHNSGQFTFAEKLKDAVRKNFRSILFSASVGITYVVYMMVTSEGSLSQIIGFLKAMGNTYGVLLITVLMGNGLIGLPRRFWHYADTEMELYGLYMAASNIETSYQDARFELEDCEWDVSKAADKLLEMPLDSQFAIDMGKNMITLQNLVANFTFVGRSTTRKYVNHAAGDDHSLALDTRMGLVELHARLKKSQIRARASERKWRMLIKQCQVAEIVIASSEGCDGEEGVNWCVMPNGINGTKDAWYSRLYCTSCFVTIKEFCSNIFSTRFMKILSRIASIFLAIISVIILWSEAVIATGWRSPVGYLMGAYNPQRAENALVMQGVSFLALSYMSICTYWSLFRLNLGWSYTLQGPQQSPPASLIFNGQYFSRLQFALGYNFLLLLNVSKTSDSSFNQIMSNMTLIPVFGTSFTVYVPLVMILVAFITMVNGYARILRVIGIESDDSYRQSNVSSLFCCFNCCIGRSRPVPLNDEESERYEAGKKFVAIELKAQAQSALKSKNVRQNSSISSNMNDLSHNSSTRSSISLDCINTKDVSINNPIWNTNIRNKSNNDNTNILKNDKLESIEFTKISDFGLDDDEEVQEPYYGGRYANV
jgi:hypothetical protein